MFNRKLKKIIKGKNNTVSIGDNCSFRKTTIRINGKNNKLIIEDGCKFDRANINITANNSIVFIDEKTLIKKSDVVILDGFIIAIGNNCEIVESSILNQYGHGVFIGDNCILSNHNLACQSPLNKGRSEVVIGKNCMFGRGSRIFTTDFHPVLDLDTNKAINKDGDVIIGDHVWLSRDVTVTKNVKICDDVIIGLGSHVYKDVETSHCAYAGNPLKVIKNNITWNK